jgi:hypothetical protein
MAHWRFLYRDPRAVGRWLAGTQDVPPAIGMLLRLMIVTGYSPERTAALIGRARPDRGPQERDGAAPAAAAGRRRNTGVG